VVNDGNRKARLDAMAQGGTAGVQAFDAAQQAAHDSRAGAINDTLSEFTWHAGNSQQADPLRALIEQRTAPAVRDAELGRTLEGEQVGYEAGAREGYLKQGRQSIADMMTDWERKQALARQEAAMSVSSGGGSGGGSGDGFAGTGYTKEELETILKGAGELAQQQEQSGYRNKASVAQVQGGAEAAIKRALGIAAKSPQYASLELMAETKGKVNDVQRGLEKANREYGWKQMAGRRDRRSLIEELLGSATRAGFQDERFSRDAALQAGLDPLLAYGLFADDPGAEAQRMQDAMEQANLYQYGDPEGEAGLRSDAASRVRDEQTVDRAALAEQFGMSPTKANAIANTFMLDPGDPEAFGAQLDVLSAIDDMVVKRRTEGATLDEIVNEMVADTEVGYTAEEINYVLSMYGRSMETTGQGGF
jgi:hypothetical protein